ncbi:MAG: tRNA (adenosine(37)-N6)-dimethylallyltransferase MiaA [Vampirovibrio sp.]
MSSSPEIIIVTGATATGKTGLGIALAKTLRTDVISCDSQLVYQGLDIGTAKPSLDEQAGIPHYGMDLVAPDQVFSAAMYEEAVLPLVLERLHTQQTVVMVGGTGFYLRQLFEARPMVEVPPNLALRSSLEQEVMAQKNSHPNLLHERLTQWDPVRASQLEPQDQRRIIRALEIIDATGQPVSQLKRPSVVESAWGRPPRIRWLGLVEGDKQARYQKIESRIEAMLKAGWLTEVETLLQQFGSAAHALQVAHGYPEWVKVLEGQLSMEEAKSLIAIHVRQYARRQKVWFNRHRDMHWCDVSQQPHLTAQLSWALNEA